METDREESMLASVSLPSEAEAGGNALPDREESAPHRIARSAVGLSILSVLGPLSGFLVEIALGWRYGVGSLVDGYRVGLVFFLFAQSVAWGILPNLVVPLFSEATREKRASEGWRVISELGLIFLAIGIGIAIGGSLCAPLLARWLAPGLDAAGLTAATAFVRSFCLAILPLAWSGILTGLFQCHGIFWVQPAAQALYNLILLGAILWGGPDRLVLAPILGCSLVGILFLGRLLPLARRGGVSPWVGRICSPRLGAFFWNGVPLFLTMGVGYVGVIFLTRATSLLAAGSVASFGYAWKILQLGLIVPGALATVLFPRMSEAWGGREPGEFQRLWQEGLRWMIFLSTPLMLLCVILSRDLVSVLFARGAFSGAAIEETSMVVAILGLAIPAAAGTAFLQKGFYSRGETLFPSIISVLGAILVMALSEATARKFGLLGLAWLNPSIGWMTFLCLAFSSRSADSRSGQAWSHFLARMLVASTAAGLVAYWASQWISSGSLVGSVLRLGLASTCSVITYLLILSALGLSEAARLLVYAGWQLRAIMKTCAFSWQRGLRGLRLFG
ncbi:murein biosynthesis integral membrane protein MurJ [Methylacidimicrobium sp. B4]|uniref:murein biosynthesis integral membrane protein MurJ n=1 Tax=Methylacidimicrobium sp. B4 TaxID=2796139 RepID=UPI001A8D1150|nr:lipid II flippase MurJ [Methylacidimicrobium sp. B4]QSR85456.1 hypothetical protein MacB4_04280 [Methylacidimicrobium sp. B4]